MVERAVEGDFRVCPVLWRLTRAENCEIYLFVVFFFPARDYAAIRHRSVKLSGIKSATAIQHPIDGFQVVPVRFYCLSAASLSLEVD